MLSGFVIASRYRERIAARAVRVRDFVILRLTRLYPLHLVTLVAMAGEEVYRYRTWARLTKGAPADAAGNTVASFLANLGMLQGLHVNGQLTWNRPSWSISAELAAYMLFAAAWFLLRARAWIAELLLVVGAPLLLWRLKGHLDATYDWGGLRAAFGFALGVVVQRAWQGGAWRTFATATSTAGHTVLETLAAVAMVAFVSIVDRDARSLAAPFVFAGVVAAFVPGRGGLSRVMQARSAQAIGRWSYSIYLLHYPIQIAVYWVAVWAFYRGALQLDVVGTNSPIIHVSPWVADLANVTMLLVVIGCSALAYRVIERPWRDRGRRWVGR